MATPALPEQTQAAARAKGIERYESFVEALGRRISKGPSFLREVSFDIERSGQNETRIEEDRAPSPT